MGNVEKCFEIVGKGNFTNLSSPFILVHLLPSSFMKRNYTWVKGVDRLLYILVLELKVIVSITLASYLLLGYFFTIIILIKNTNISHH